MPLNVITFSSGTAKAHSRLHNVMLCDLSTCCIAPQSNILLRDCSGEPAQNEIRGCISKMKLDIQKKKWTSIYNKMGVN